MKESLPIALGAGLGAAACFGIATAVQHVEAGRVVRRGPLNPRLLGELARRRLWLLSFVAEGLAIGLQALGLRFGPVALVQSLIVGGLPVAVVLSVLLGARRLTGRAIAGLVLCSVGIAVFALVQPAATVAAGIPGVRRTLVAGAAGALVVVVLLRLGRTGRAGGAAAGAAAGVAIGAGSVLLAVCAGQIDRPAHLLGSWPPYALVAIGLVGLVLAQSAFQTGALGPPLASLTVVEPATAVVLAAVLLDQPLPAGALELVLAGCAAVLATVGVVLLAGPD